MKGRNRENEYGKGEEVGREGRRGRGSEARKILEARMDTKADDKGWRPVRKHGERARRTEADGKRGQPCAASRGPQRPGRLVKPWPWGVREPCRQLPLLGTWVRINPLVTEALEGPLIPHHQELWTPPTGPLPAELGVKARRPRPRAGLRRCGLLLSPWSPTFHSEPPSGDCPQDQRACGPGPQPHLPQGRRPHVIPKLYG